MPTEYKQGERPLIVTTPLGPDKLLLVGFEGTEQISGLYSFRLDMIAPNLGAKEIKFDQILGQELTVKMRMQTADPNSTTPEYRYFSGICQRFQQGDRDMEFTQFRAEIVPKFWLTTRVAQSRIFQQMTVPDILKKVLTGLDIENKIEGTFEPRDYCVQYRETDFNFACRLMEEEGIYFFFKHAEGSHKLVLANTPASHADVPGITKVQWDVVAGNERQMRHIHEWAKRQEIRSGKYTLWDHSFERPTDNLESKKNTLDTVAVGTVTHKLKTAGNENFEIYDYPGEYAQRFDGISPSGGEQPANVSKITPDGTRTVELRMQAETLAGLVIEGSSNCNQFTSGHKFTLEKHFDANGKYILTAVHHVANSGNAYRSGGEGTLNYSNTFSCIPEALPYRPQRTTPKPCVMGAQTAVVVGPAGEEIFTDKYGRVKVQFPWDRESKADANSSCWLRVGTSWAGKNWGTIHIPRVGHEVIVQFLEGDPDSPIIIGSVYNAGAMPPYKLPDNKTISTVKSLSSLKGAGFNEIRFEDKKGEEQVFIHGEKNMDIRVKNDRFETIINNRHLLVKKDKFEHVENNRDELVDADHKEKIGKDRHLKVVGKEAKDVGGSLSLTVTGLVSEVFKADHSESTTGKYSLKGADVVIEGTSSVTIKVGGCYIAIDSSGIEIKSPATTVKGDASLTLQGGMVKIN